ncbi:Hint domain-containing protein [Paracoccus sp. (in: a-proteobacteria)]|uniref:Hint domain-containing protein n=1 Tax=Paracoccus sp. TaxID=267 RepID=UPI00272BDF83|nr:Hint domain-containing protein [Paracoccus sp. (in: a-proteobacteria)]
MSTFQLTFANDQLGDFNSVGLVISISPPSIDQQLRINNNHPADRLIAAGAITSRADVTGWRLTVTGSQDPAGNTAVPFAPIVVEYSTDGGTSWNSFTADIGRPDLVYFARQDEADWMAITAIDLTQPDGQTGFIVSNFPVTPGQIFQTDESVLEPQIGEFLIPCFASDTLIRTASGEMRVDAITAGTLVWTEDRGLRPVAWAGQRHLDANMLDRAPHLRPILIRAGALGEGAPERNLRLSPQHRVLVRSKVAERMFGATEVLVAARHLLDLPGVEIDRDATGVTYVHLLFDRHELLRSNGLVTESLYTGRQALKAVGAAARREIAMLFPEILDLDHDPQPARPLTRGRRARQMVARHHQRGKPLLAAQV